MTSCQCDLFIVTPHHYFCRPISAKETTSCFRVKILQDKYYVSGQNNLLPWYGQKNPKTFEAQGNVPYNPVNKYKVSLSSVRLIPGPTDYRIATGI